MTINTQDKVAAFLRDRNSVPICELGHIHGSEVDTDSSRYHALGTVAGGATATFPTAGEFSPGLYECHVALDSDVIDGLPGNVFIAPHKGGTPPTNPETTWWLEASSERRQFPIVVRIGQNKVSFRNPTGGATLRIYMRKKV